MRSLSPGTLQSYRSAAWCYLAFYKTFGISSTFPLSKVVLGRFVALLTNKHLSYVTIHVYLSALHFTQIASGFCDPSLSSLPHLNYVLRGIRRSLSQCKRPKRLPIPPNILRRRLFRVWSCPPVSCQTMIMLMYLMLCVSSFLVCFMLFPSYWLCYYYSCYCRFVWFIIFEFHVRFCTCLGE